MWRLGRTLWSNSDGAVAPTVALSLIGLVAIGGVAFDYAHLAAMDTELQQAADQAALAAATQLDGQTGAIARATAAAQYLITNTTLLAGGGGSNAVTVPTITFCSAFDDSKPDGPAPTGACTTTTLDSNAKVVWVKVGGRTANYTLTPIVGLFSSGTISAEGVAGMSSAVCKEPPVMMCNPAIDPTKFDVNSYIGRGILLIAKGSGSTYAPGDFGFLDVGAGASDLGKLMAYGSPPDKCVDVTQPSTEPGAMTSVINDFNTRFDVFESGDSNNCFSQSKCPPSLNSRKDIVINHGSPYTKNNCGILTGGGGNGWNESVTPYRPTSATVNSYTLTPDAMGYPRDKPHAWTSSPASRIGDGTWDIDAYWRVNHAGTAIVIDATKVPPLKGYPTSMNSTIMAAAPLPAGVTRSYPTRYQVYKWEMADAAAQLPSRSLGGGLTDYGQPVCKPNLVGSTPGSTTADRRTLPIAVVNCAGLNGKAAVNPIDWVDSFLVEPSMKRGGGAYTAVGDIYVEIVGRTSNGTGGTTAQFIRHDRPYLIR